MPMAAPRQKGIHTKTMINGYYYIILYCTCFIGITSSQWTSSSFLLPRASGLMAAGSSNGSIFLLGNWASCTNQLVEFVIANAETDPFIDYGCSSATATPESTYGEGDFYTQVGPLLYFIDPWVSNTLWGKRLSIFNTMSKAFTTSWATIPVSVYYKGCLTSYLQYLYVIGGYNDATSDTLNLLQILDTNRMLWLDDAPSMNLKRNRPSCIVDADTSKLYAIGGNYGSLGYFSSYHNTIEQINTNNILQNSWEVITGTLTDPAIGIRSVIYQHMIYMIGGEYNNGNGWIAINTVHILDPTTDTITLAPERLPYYEAYGAAIIDDDVLYVFGGVKTGTFLSKWMQYQFSDSETQNPTESTNVPTLRPTNIPTFAPTNKPTSSPTDIPSTAPTKTTTDPSSQPTHVPTSTPTNVPTISPTDPPTSLPTDITNIPTISPINKPTSAPTNMPSSVPTDAPSSAPIYTFSTLQTESPTNEDNKHVSSTSNPTFAPTQPLDTLSPTGSPSDVQIGTTTDEDIHYSTDDNDEINAVSSKKSIGIIVAVCGVICVVVSICGLYILHLKRKIYDMQVADTYIQETVTMPGSLAVSDDKDILDENKIVEASSNPQNEMNETMEGNFGEESNTESRGSFVAEGQVTQQQPDIDVDTFTGYETAKGTTTQGDECNANLANDEFVVRGNDD